MLTLKRVPRLLPGLLLPVVMSSDSKRVYPRGWVKLAHLNQVVMRCIQ